MNVLQKFYKSFYKITLFTAFKKYIYLKNVHCKLQIKSMSYMLIDQLQQRVFYESKVKHNSLLKIIHISCKLVSMKVRERMLAFPGKACSLGFGVKNLIIEGQQRFPSHLWKKFQSPFYTTIRHVVVQKHLNIRQHCGLVVKNCENFQGVCAKSPFLHSLDVPI